MPQKFTEEQERMFKSLKSDTMEVLAELLQFLAKCQPKQKKGPFVLISALYAMASISHLKTNPNLSPHEVEQLVMSDSYLQMSAEAFRAAEAELVGILREIRSHN